jgi:hypothetical protein
MKRLLLAMTACAVQLAAAAIPVLIVDGQNNHKWQETTPVLKRLLEETGKFTVDVSTSPAKAGTFPLTIRISPSIKLLFRITPILPAIRGRRRCGRS